MSEFHTIPFFIGHHDPARHGIVEEELLHHAEDVGYDTITTRITNEKYQPQVLSYLSKYMQELENPPEIATDPSSFPPLALPPLTANDTTLSPSDIAPRLLHVTSAWIDLASSDSVISKISAQVLDLEVSYVAFCGASNVLIRGPSPRSSVAGLAQYARAIKRALQAAPAASIQILLPVTYEIEWDASADLGDLSHFARDPTQQKDLSPGVRPDALGSWDTWDVIRSMCNQDSRLSVALVLPRHLPSTEIQTRWLSEPIRLLNIPKSSFTPNKFATPVLSQAHRAFLSRCLRLKSTPWFLLSHVGPLPGEEPLHLTAPNNGDSTSNGKFINATPQHQGSLSPLSMHPTPAEASYQYQPDYSQYPVHPSQNPTAHLEYLRTQIQPRQPPLTPIEHYGAGYQDFPQSPLQPLTDNLESVTYEVFEKDPVKYAQYEAALAAALRDWARNGKQRSAPGARVLVAVVGAGRGPLVQRALRANETTNVPIDVWAIEKNPSAFVHLQRRNVSEWSSQVHLVQSDMRSWRGPSYVNPQTTAGAENYQYGSQPSIPATFRSADTHCAIDIVVSELLGSFADNELSPECLDGISHLLVPGHSISIPSSYTAHMTPIAAPRLWSDIKARPATPRGADATSLPYVAWLHAIDYLSTATPRPSNAPSINPTPLPSNNLATSNSQADPIVKQAWQFSHPLPLAHILPSNTHNERFVHLTFLTPNRGVCHGLAGYFECVLYAPTAAPPSSTPGFGLNSPAASPQAHPFSNHPHTYSNANTNAASLPNGPTSTHTDPGNNITTPTPATKKKAIELSTHPLTMPQKSADMISWFPIFFPLHKPLMVVDDGEVGVSMWRVTDGRKVWYEWCVDVWGPPVKEDGHGGSGKGREMRRKVGGSGVVSSEKEGCLM